MSSAIAELLGALDKIEVQTSHPSWQDSLEKRKQDELRFHDDKRERNEEGEDRDHVEEWANKKYYTTTASSRRYVNDWVMKNVKGKVVLDYACGNGTRAIQAVHEGARFAVGIDISPVSIENARSEAERHQVVDKVRFVVGDAEATGLPDESIDVILCMGVLHHLDLGHALPEMSRILKPGGVAFGLEALDYNPLIKLYRRRTPHLRTAWEKDHILSHSDLRFASKWFKVKNIRYWHMASLVATPFRHGRAFRPLLAMGRAADALITRVPLLRRLSWMFSFELRKN